MPQSEVQLLALLCLAAAIVAAELDLLGYLCTAATVNGVLSVLFVRLEAPSLIAWGLRRLTPLGITRSQSAAGATIFPLMFGPSTHPPACTLKTEKALVDSLRRVERRVQCH